MDDVRAAESTALTQTPPGALMQRAAAALAAACAAELRATRGRVSGGRVSGAHVVLLVGSGNNGGDALFAGARLAARGAAVTALLAGSRAHAEGSAALRAVGGRLLDTSTTPPDVVSRVIASADLVIDGLIGLGATAGLHGAGAALAAQVRAGLRPQIPVVAVDLPSGVAPDTGELPEAGNYLPATLTVTFGAAKPCLLLPPAAAQAGRVQLVDLGFAAHLPDRPAVDRLTRAEAAALWPVPSPSADKYRRGVVGVIAGSQQYTGAAVLCVGGALHAGAGMVRYLGPPAATDQVRARWPEAVLGHGQVQAWVLGSGVDPAAGDGQSAAIETAISSGLPCVIDAGALQLVTPAAQPAGAPRLRANIVLTPHAGELARLLTTLGEHDQAQIDQAQIDQAQIERADVEARPYWHARRACELTGATVLLKGAITLVLSPDGRCRSQAEAPSWLATAGAGDVLAGLTGTLLAAGLDPFDAASLAALVHGEAAQHASRGGPIIADDVIAALSATIAELLTADGGAGAATLRR